MNIDFENHTVAIKALTGSHASNLNTPESDKDWKFFVLPTFNDLYFGLEFSNAGQSPTFDYDIHDIRKLGKLIYNSNVNFSIVLFAHEYSCLPEFKWIFNNADELGSINLPCFYNATMGTHYQKMKELFKGTDKTDALIEKFGYDTKQATHSMRCLFILERMAIYGLTMRKAMWFEEGYHRTTLLDIKAGRVNLEDFTQAVSEWHERYKVHVAEYFKQFSPNEELRQELNNRIKEVVGINLRYTIAGVKI
jgi:predicted nucleotidyltransferase